MKKWFIFLLFPALQLSAASLDDAGLTPIAKQYIDRYKAIAVAEMHRTGIPASIKLAQGLLESDWGRSELAQQAHNHFGIKCGGRWEGQRFYKDDDDYHKGKLVPSCFRVFADDAQSYVAHSDFLLDPKKDYRYGFLFDYPNDAYKDWARGLLKAGYATDKKYPEKLITIIEKYDLHQFDVAAPAAHTDYELDLPTEAIPEARPIASYQARERHAKSITTRAAKTGLAIAAINRVPMVRTLEGQTINDVAAIVGLSADNLMLYNDGIDQPTDVLAAGSIVYLQKKKRSFVGEVSTHTVAEGETIASISQRYGIKAANLFAKNRMPKDAEPVVGEVLNLRKTVPSSERPRYTRSEGKVPSKFLEFEKKG